MRFYDSPELSPGGGFNSIQFVAKCNPLLSGAKDSAPIELNEQ